MNDESKGGSRPTSDEIDRQRTRLARRFAVVGSPLILCGVVLALLDNIGTERWQWVPLLVGLLINLAAWPIGAWRYPRPLHA